MKANLLLKTCLAALLILVLGTAHAQDNAPDSLPVAKVPKLDFFPAISYSPETKLTLGGIGIKYFDFRKGDAATPLSTLEFFAVYTTAKQTLIEARWEVFTHQKKWRTRGEAIFNHYVDRNYGIGNEAALQLVDLSDADKPDSLNYLLFKADRWKWSPAVLRKLGPDLFLGLQYDLEWMRKVDAVPDSYYFLNADSSRLLDLPVAGVRAGLGLQLLYDTRDFVANPLHGTLVEVNGLGYAKWLGSDFDYGRFMVDARHYVNTRSNQVLALRGWLSLQPSEGPIPLRGLSRTNGHKLVRGYFRGTYQDRHMAAFEAEYRLPFWREGARPKPWQVWKRLGMVAFVSGAQAFHSLDEFAFQRFHLAAGGGLRILMNPSSRVNIRVDYAFGLHKGSDGTGQRQKGLYFFLAEAF